MKVTYNWLKEFVDIKISAAELAEKLTMAGLEVKAVEERAGDFIFEIEITSNRPDWLSIIGVAREAAALTGKMLKSSQGKIEKLKISRLEKFAIEIESKSDCPVYTAKIIRNVKVGPSPQWLKTRLELVGVRSVNNLVDITNYVLFETGEPLHAFDLDKINGQKIIIRRAKSGENLVTIDGQTRKLSPDILVIADREKSVAIAGVMGGKDTEVTENTKNVLLEAAIFDPVLVRRGRQKLGMNSDAAYRFERGIDPESPDKASLKAIQLIGQLCEGEQGYAGSSGKIQRKELKVYFSVSSIKKYLGIDISRSKIKNILTSLGFGMKLKTGDIFIAGVPSWRLDVKTEVDLIEEIARIYGYANIPATLAAVNLTGQAASAPDYIALTKDILVALGMNEVITYSLTDRKSLDGFWDPKEALIEVSNPLSIEQEVMRPVLLPSLIRCVAHNLRQQNSDINIFEIAKTYFLERGKIREKYSLGIALCGIKPRWFGPQVGQVQDAVGFLHLKGILDELGQRLGIKEQLGYKFINSYEIRVFINEEEVGVLRTLSKIALEEFDIKHKDVFVAEILLEEKIIPLIRPEKKFNMRKIFRYPAIIRDVTLELKDEISFQDIIIAAGKIGEELLVWSGFADYYKGEKVQPGFKRITISCKYCALDRTLTEEEVALKHDRVVRVLQEKFQAKTC